MAGGASYCQLADVKQLLGITDTASDALLSALIPAASRFIDTFTHYPEAGWNQETLTETVPVTVERDGQLRIRLNKPVIVSVASVAILYEPAQPPLQEPVTGPTSALWPLEPVGDTIRLNDPSWLQYRGRRLYAQVTYTGGYGLPWLPNPPEPLLPDDIRYACQVLTARAFRSKDAGFSDAVGVDQLGTLVFSKVMPREIQAILMARRRVALG